MKNIEKYYDAIAEHLKTTGVLNLGCAVFDIRVGSSDCGDCDCEDCCIKSIKWLNEEYEEPKHILTDKEKEIVRAMCDVILRFGVRIINISKSDIPYNKYYLGICYESDICNNRQVISTPLFMDDKFKGMELEKKYSLEELGITCQTQKDS